MLNNLGLHVMKNPAGTYSFVGTIPAKLGKLVPATKEDVMGGRAHKHPETGELLTIKFPVFGSRSEAVDYALCLGFAVKDH